MITNSAHSSVRRSVGCGGDSAAISRRATIEMNAAGSVYPVVYVRRGGTVAEHVLEPEPQNAYDGPGYLAELEGLLRS